MSRFNSNKQEKKRKSIFFIVFFVVLCIMFPILIIFVLIGLFKFNINLDKIIKSLGITDYLKNNFGANYEKIILEIKKTKQYQQRVKTNRKKRSHVEDLYTDNRGVEINEGHEKNTEARFNEMQRMLDAKKNKEKIFYQQNKITLQEKFSKEVKKKKTVHTSHSSWRDSIKSTHNNKNNYFGNTKTSTVFGEGKSIWDNYESVTDKFSSKNK